MEASCVMSTRNSLRGKDKEIAKLTGEKEALAARVEELQGTINTQLETISSLSGKASDTKAMENRNRELHNRSENMKEEVATVKARLKALQKDLAAERTELAALKKFDPDRMRKNLDANKRKLAEKTKAAEALQKSYNQSKAENARLEQRVKVEAQQAEANTDEEVQDDSGSQAAA